MAHGAPARQQEVFRGQFQMSPGSSARDAWAAASSAQVVHGTAGRSRAGRVGSAVLPQLGKGHCCVLWWIGRTKGKS